jgi:hypothetical protein
MADDRIRVGFVGCGGISRLYTDVYTGLVDIAQVVAVADLVEGLADKRREVLTETYTAEAHRARALVAETRSDKERATQLKRMRQKIYCAAAIAHAGVGNYGHGLHLV